MNTAKHYLVQLLLLLKNRILKYCWSLNYWHLKKFDYTISICVYTPSYDFFVINWTRKKKHYYDHVPTQYLIFCFNDVHLIFRIKSVKRYANIGRELGTRRFVRFT